MPNGIDPERGRPGAPVKRTARSKFTAMTDAALLLPDGPPAHGPTPWKIIQADVLARAKYRCEECGAAGKLVAVSKGANPQGARSYRALCEAGCPE